MGRHPSSSITVSAGDGKRYTITIRIDRRTGIVLVDETKTTLPWQDASPQNGKVFCITETPLPDGTKILCGIFFQKNGTLTGFYERFPTSY